MRKTFKQIIDELELFCNDHKMINDFGFGEVSNISTKDHKFPMVWVQPIASTSGVKVTLKFEIYVMDVMRQDRSNLLDIINDTLMIGNDIVAEYFDSEEEFDFTLDESGVTVTPFEGDFDDLTSGWIFEVSIDVQNGLDSCSIPK